MSKGLGKLQRDILNSLDKASEAKLFYRGRDRCGEHWDWIVVNGQRVKLADGIYDLRETLKYLAIKYNKTYCHSFVWCSFQASFSRAVKRLVVNGHLKHLTLVPLKESEIEPEPYSNTLMILADGLYLNITGRQIRFIQKGKNT